MLWWMKGSKNKGLASQPTILHGLRVQTAAEGQVIPLLYGRNRISGKLLWYGDFQAIPQTSQPNVGGKGGGGQSSSSTTYTYQAAVAIALGEGEATALLSIWDTKGNQTQLFTQSPYTIPSSPYQIAVALGSFYQDLGVSFVQSYTDTYNDYGSAAPQVVSGTNYVPLTNVSPAAPTATGQYSVDATGLYTFYPGDTGKAIQISYTYTGTAGVPAQTYGLALFSGAQGQAPWGYLVANHPGQDLGYTLLTYVATSLMDLGSSAELPNLSYEIVGLLPFSGDGDCNPRDVVYDLLTSKTHGVGVDSSVVDPTSLAQYSSYCLAYDLLVSPFYDSQRTALDLIQELLTATNSQAFWSEGKIKFCPFGDMSRRGNGILYTPNTTPIYDLDDNDFQYEKGQDPVQVTLPTYADLNNQQQIEYLDRSNSYNPTVVEDKDQSMIDTYGLRIGSPLQYHFITTQPRAAQVANFINRRSLYIDGGAHFKFRLGWQYALLDPGDLVTITDVTLGLTLFPVRIISIEEDAKGTLSLVCEPFPFGTATPTLYPKQGGDGYIPNFNAEPGNVNPPIMFEAWNRLVNYAGYQIGVAVSGANPNWGGCEVWASQDNTTYKRIAVIVSKSRMGVTTGSLPAANDPDTVDSFGVDLSRSAGVLLAGSSSDADNFNTLCYVGAKSAAGMCSMPAGAGFTIITWVSGDTFDPSWALNPRSAMYVNGNVMPIFSVAPSGLTMTVFTFASGFTGQPFTVAGILGELISYQSATLTGPYNYTIGTRLRRGVYGSGAATSVTSGWSHVAGSAFARIDDSIVYITYDRSQSQQILYLKFLSFNQSGRNLQSLAAVSPYVFSVPGYETGIMTGEISVVNGDFESSASIMFGSGAPPNWRSVAGGSNYSGLVFCTYDTATPYAGTRSLVVTNEVSPGGAVTPVDIWQCAGGDKFFVSAAVKNNVGAGVVVGLNFYDINGVLLGSTTVISSGSSSWQLLSGVAVAPANPAVAYLRLTLGIGVNIGDQGEFDEIVLQRIKVPTPTTSNGQVLVVDDTEAAGIRWSAPVNGSLNTIILPVGSHITIDFSSGATQRINLTKNIVVDAIIGMIEGALYELEVIEDAIGDWTFDVSAVPIDNWAGIRKSAGSSSIYPLKKIGSKIVAKTGSFIA